MPYAIKIAYIGGGSQGWAPNILTELALCDQLTGEIALYDIDAAAAQRTLERGEIIFAHPEAKTRFKLTVSQTSADALRGADFVLLSIQPGPIQMFANDLDIPKKYGMLQSVGDTTGPGGISRALRSVPTKMAYAHEIMEYCPDAWVFNYTNPMTLCTAALYAAEPEIKAFGCCHEVFGTQARLAGLVADWFDVSQPDRRAIKLDINGVNHFTFATHATWEGHDLFPRLGEHVADDALWADKSAQVQARIAYKDYMPSHGLIAFDYFRRFGALGAAGDRHLAEFAPWYLADEATLHRYGVAITPSSSRLAKRKPKPTAAYLLKDGVHINPLRHTGEESVEQMVALLGGAGLDTNVNLPNRGQASDLPLGAVVETYAQFRRDEIRPVVARPLPAAVNGLVRRVMDVQQLTLTAAIERDKDLAFQALLADPLCTINIDAAWAMFNEMLAANRAMLPGWDI